MRTLLMIVSLIAFVLAGAIAQAESRKTALSEEGAKAWNALKGPAAASIFRYAKNQTITCYIGIDEKKCSLANRSYHVSIFYIFTDNGPVPEYALAVIYFSQDSGSALEFDAAIFQRMGGRDYAYKRSVDGIFGRPVGAELDGKNLAVTTATLIGGDGRCCPSGRTEWRVDIATGKATYVAGNKVGDSP